MVLIRFIINFVLFGALFYLIWHFFPDAFQTLVSWVKTLVEFTQDLIRDLYSRLAATAAKKDLEPAKTLIQSFISFIKI